MRRAVVKLGASAGLTVASVCVLAGNAGAEEAAQPASAQAALAKRDDSHCKLAVQLDGKPVSRVKLSIDGHRVDAEKAGTTVDTSPGRHVVTAVVGLKKVDLVTHLQPGEKKVVRVPSPAAPMTLALPVSPRDGEREPLLSQQWQRTAGLVVGGAGVLGIGVAGAFFADAMHKRAEAARACSGPAACEPRARFNLDARANDSGNVAAVAAVTGLALAGAGAILYLTAPAPAGMKDLKFSPTLAAGMGGGISAKASF